MLVDQGVVTEIELAEALAEAYGLKSVDLVGYPVDVAAAAKIPIALARRHRVLGIAIDDDEIVVAIADPGDVLALDDVRAATGLQVRPVVVARDELTKAHRPVPAGRERPRRRRREPRRATTQPGIERPRVGRRRSADRPLRQLA